MPHKLPRKISSPNTTHVIGIIPRVRKIWFFILSCGVNPSLKHCRSVIHAPGETYVPKWSNMTASCWDLGSGVSDAYIFVMMIRNWAVSIIIRIIAMISILWSVA